MSIDQREPGVGRPGHNVDIRKLAIRGAFTAGVGLTGIVAGVFVSESNRPTPIFDCAVGRDGTIDLDISKGKDLSMRSVNGSSAFLRQTRGGDVTLFIKDSDGKSVSLQVPAGIEDDSAVYEISEATVGKKTLVVVTAICKQQPSLSPIPTSTK